MSAAYAACVCTHLRQGLTRLNERMTRVGPWDSVGMKQIVVGRRGSTIGQIGIRARTILEEMFGRRVHLVLNVKIRKKNNSLTGRRRTAEFALY